MKKITEDLMHNSTQTVDQMIAIAKKEPRNFNNTIKILAMFESDFDKVST